MFHRAANASADRAARDARAAEPGRGSSAPQPASARLRRLSVARARASWGQCRPSPSARHLVRGPRFRRRSRPSARRARAGPRSLGRARACGVLGQRRASRTGCGSIAPAQRHRQRVRGRMAMRAPRRIGRRSRAVSTPPPHGRSRPGTGKRAVEATFPTAQLRRRGAHIRARSSHRSALRAGLARACAAPHHGVTLGCTPHLAAAHRTVGGPFGGTARAAVRVVPWVGTWPGAPGVRAFHAAPPRQHLWRRL